MPSQKAAPIRAARFSLGDERLVRAECVDVDVMATSAEAASTAEGIALGLYPNCGMSRDDLALDVVAVSQRLPPAAPALNRSKCEAIFPNDLAAKLVSFGNAARLGRGVSLCRVHSQPERFSKRMWRRQRDEYTHARHFSKLLRARRERPRGCRAAEKCDEFPPPHGADPRPTITDEV